MAHSHGVYYPEGSDTYDLPADWEEHAESDAQQALDAAANAAAAAISEAVSQANTYTDAELLAASGPRDISIDTDGVPYLDPGQGTHFLLADAQGPPFYRATFASQIDTDAQGRPYIPIGA